MDTSASADEAFSPLTPTDGTPYLVGDPDYPAVRRRSSARKYALALLAF